MAFVVKRRGKVVPFDEEKLHSSIISACTECDLPGDEAEKIAAEVIRDVQKLFHDRKQVNSTEIFGHVIQILAKEHEAVAFMYETHREIPK